MMRRKFFSVAKKDAAAQRSTMAASRQGQTLTLLYLANGSSRLLNRIREMLHPAISLTDACSETHLAVI